MNPRPEHGFGFLLHDIARLLRKRFDHSAATLGLSRAQWQVLAHLHRHEGINQSGLAEILEIKGVTLGRLVDRLEAAGWVERRADASDRRARRRRSLVRRRPAESCISREEFAARHGNMKRSAAFYVIRSDRRRTMRGAPAGVDFTK